MAEGVLCRVYRVAHGADIIPYLPPKLLEYEDVGPEIFITSTGRVLFNQKVLPCLLIDCSLCPDCACHATSPGCRHLQVPIGEASGTVTQGSR